MPGLYQAIAQALNPPTHDPRTTFDLLGYTPTPRQAEFHAATEFDVLYGGAAGGGKTKALLLDAIRYAVQHPGLRVGAFRRTFPEIRESFLPELASIGFAASVGGHWNGGEYELRFDNGSLIMFRYVETLADATRRQGGQYQLLIFDERTLTPPEAVAFLYSRLRSGRKDLPVIGIRSGSNPGGQGHAAVKAAYIDATDYGSKVITDARGRTVRFIPSRVDDNPHVNPEYRQDLQTLPEAMRKAFLDGSWDAFAGQVFTEWDRDRHVVPAFVLPDSWPRHAGVDWGYAAPWAVVWAAVDEDGRVWIYDELYDTKVGESEQARRVLAAENGRQVTRYADDAMWTSRGDALPVAQVYANEGCHLIPARKGERIIGWQRVHTYLGDGPACPHHRAQGWATCPRLHVLDGAAPNLVRTLPALPYAITASKVEDVDSRAEDHAPDALRYLLINLAEPVIDRWAIPDPPETGVLDTFTSTATAPAWWSPDSAWEVLRGSVGAPDWQGY